VHGDHVVLQRNPSYFRGRPKLERIVLYFNDWNPSITEFRTGAVDMLLSMPVSKYSIVDRLADQTTYRTATAGFYLALFNMRAVSDVRLRRAIVQAIDTQFVTNGATRGAVRSPKALKGMFNAFYDSSVRGIALDRSAARRTLGTGTKTRVIRLISDTDPDSDAADVLIQEQLRRVGVNVEIKTFATSQLFDPVSGPIARGDFDLFFTFWWALPTYYPSWFFLCSTSRVSGNYGSYCNPAMDKLYADSLRRFDTTGLRRDYSAMQRGIWRDVPFVPLWQYTRIDVCRNGLVGCSTGQAWPSSLSDQWAWMDRSRPSRVRGP